MTEFKNNKYKVESADIKTDNCGGYETEYFVDNLSGKNILVLKSLNEAIVWCHEN